MNNGAMNATPPTAHAHRTEPPGPAPSGNGHGAHANGVARVAAQEGTEHEVRLGQERADFEVLYARHSREDWALAYARWMNADTAMDITQEAFLRLWKKWEDGEAILSPRAWLLRVARNLAEDHAKSAFRRNGTHPPQTMNGVQAHQALPLENMEREETFAQLREVMHQLPQADREILTLRYALE